MPDVTVPTAPALARKANVELIHTGTWKISTGEWTVTKDDLAAAVSALDCPAVRRPVLKLGHTDPRFDGEPAVGWVDNLATAEQGHLLAGDYVGMPGWLGDVIASAYPDRSVEGQYDFRCQIGHTHPFVLTAVALLGVQAPGIGTLESLQDVAALYGVAAAGQDVDGQRIAITLTGGAMPNPRAAEIAAGVTTEDVRRAFYASPTGDGWDTWIEEIQLEPLQLIAMNDATGKRARIPVEIGEGDGEDAVSFGAAVDVVVRYDDVAASAGPQAVRYASREESRPADPPPGKKAEKKATTPLTAAEAAARIHSASVKGHTQEGTPVDFTTDQLAALRTTLGIPDGEELEPAKVLAAVEGLKGPQVTETPAEPVVEPEKVAAGPKTAGTMVIDASAWDEREARIKRLEAAAKKREREERDEIIAASIRVGKFAPSRKEHWARLWDADPEGTREVLAGLTKNVIPVDALGIADDGDSTLDDEFRSLFPPAQKGA